MGASVRGLADRGRAAAIRGCKTALGLGLRSAAATIASSSTDRVRLLGTFAGEVSSAGTIHTEVVCTVSPTLDVSEFVQAHGVDFHGIGIRDSDWAATKYMYFVPTTYIPMGSRCQIDPKILA